ncbi:DUF3237 domain-containing protein [Nocardia arizonensis]|uniref:DUF3237 domain-containing protein n=1 Tax=Nocardia arizonensis TaxID=1141647 RepID=UPI0006D05951|nr:DUF3237 domain-containing protein [Nocardia arizonensis]
MDARIRTAQKIDTAELFDIVVDLEPRLDFGAGPLGRRVLFRAAGGSFEGERLRGTVVTGGGDWALFRPDGTMLLDVRLTLRTDDEELVHMTYQGRWVRSIDPERGYFRTAPLFETGSTRYGWLNDIVCVGTGYLVDGGVAYHVEQVL